MERQPQGGNVASLQSCKQFSGTKNKNIHEEEWNSSPQKDASFLVPGSSHMFICLLGSISWKAILISGDSVIMFHWLKDDGII